MNKLDHPRGRLDLPRRAGIRARHPRVSYYELALGEQAIASRGVYDRGSKVHLFEHRPRCSVPGRERIGIEDEGVKNAVDEITLRRSARSWISWKARVRTSM